MDGHALLPVAAVSTSFIAAMGIFLLREHRHRLRSIFNLTAALVKLALVVWMQFGVQAGVLDRKSVV